jgi:hypothetical protein
MNINGAGAQFRAARVFVGLEIQIFLAFGVRPTNNFREQGKSAGIARKCTIKVLVSASLHNRKHFS